MAYVRYLVMLLLIFNEVHTITTEKPRIINCIPLAQILLSFLFVLLLNKNHVRLSRVLPYWERQNSWEYKLTYECPCPAENDYRRQNSQLLCPVIKFGPYYHRRRNVRAK